jgi:hypothetical protein
MEPPEQYSIISFSSEKLQGHCREGSSSSANTLRSRVELVEKISRLLGTVISIMLSSERSSTKFSTLPISAELG